MIQTTNNLELVEKHQEYTDKYFTRSREILAAEGINPIVRYQVFCRQDFPSLKGVDEAVDFVKSVAGEKARVYVLRDGDNYTAGEPLMKIEGRVQDLVELETVNLGLLSGNLTGEIYMPEVRERARAIVQAAEGIQVYYFGARHFHPMLDQDIARICMEEGFAGTSTDIGAKAWNSKGLGTIPHALILSYAAEMDLYGLKGNPTVEAARGFDRNIDARVPRIVLIDTFNREVEDSIETARLVPSLKGVRIDTCGENYTQYSQDVRLPKFDVDESCLRGKGVKIASVWALRQGLSASGLGHLELTVSSGFNAGKTAAFVEANKKYQEIYGKPLFHSIGSGSIARPVMTTSDIVGYFNEKTGLWIALSKVGRKEVPSDRLVRR